MSDFESQDPYRGEPGTPDPQPDAPPAPEAPKGFFDLAVGFITEPVATFRVLAQQQPVWWALLLVAGIMALMFAVQMVEIAAGPDLGGPGAPPPDLGPLEGLGLGATLAVGIAVGVPFSLAFFAVWVAVVMGSARLVGGAGGFGATFTGLGFAYAPSIFAVLATALVIPLGTLAGFLGALVAFGVSIWMLVLNVLAVREVHGLSTGRAVAALLIPIGVLLVLGVLLVAAVVGIALTAA